MSLQFAIKKLTLNFKFHARTSRGRIHSKDTWIVKAYDTDVPLVCGYGECGPLAGLSVDDSPDFENKLIFSLKTLAGQPIPQNMTQLAELVKQVDIHLPAVMFGVETALLDLINGGKKMIYETGFYESERPIKINGLIWMGEQETMINRLKEKLSQGFDCIKLKIGALNFEEEQSILELARKEGDASGLTLRVDANGAYNFEEVNAILEILAGLKIHSIEQPIKAGQRNKMALLCKKSPIPIALDEELIGVFGRQQKRKLLADIRPHYIILKPTLLGGFAQTEEWIELAEHMGIGWWVTSALESNIGLNAICQFTSKFEPDLPQGLGTGGLYANNIEAPLKVSSGYIKYKQNHGWNESFLQEGFSHC